MSNSFFDNLFGFFLGVRQQGMQTTEEVLRDGSFITAVGELELDGGQLRLQPTAVGPMMLTTATKNTILRRLEDAKASSMYVHLNWIADLVYLQTVTHVDCDV